MRQQPVSKKLRLRRRAGGESGAALVLLALFMVALLGFAALAIDVGQCQVQKNYIQESADATAMGAVTTWSAGGTVSAVVSIGTTLAGQNGVLASEIISITPGVWNAAAKTFTANQASFGNNAVPAVQVAVQRPVSTVFARMFGFATITVQAQSTAIVASATSAYGILPFFTCATGTATPHPCDTVVLKTKDIGSGNECGASGKFGAISLPGGNSGSAFRDTIHYGYQGTVRIGDVYSVLNGVKVGPTDQGLSARLAGAPPYNCDPANPIIPSQRLAIIAVTDSAGYNGNTVVVKQFWVMALDDPQGGNVTGRYVGTFAGQEINPSAPPVAVGVNAVALVK